MRTTLTIDDDLLAAARALAQDRAESIGQAVNELIRRGLQAAPPAHPKKHGRSFPVFAVPPGARAITAADIRRAEDLP